MEKYTEQPEISKEGLKDIYGGNIDEVIFDNPNKTKRMFDDISSDKFGRLKPVQRIGTTKFGKALWLCMCDCGNWKVVQSAHIKRGDVVSCGCYYREIKYGTKTE